MVKTENEIAKKLTEDRRKLVDECCLIAALFCVFVIIDHLWVLGVIFGVGWAVNMACRWFEENLISDVEDDSYDS